MSDPAAPPIDILAQLMTPENAPQTVEDMRNMLDTFGGMLNGGCPEVAAFHAKVPVAGGAPELTADVIVPAGDGPFPVLVYLHGGGWICGSPTTHKKLAHRFAEAGYLVFNVDYRMAPEHPFPTPFDDCVEAIRWVTRIASEYGGDPSRLAVGGDSAGGNLSAAVASALADDSDVNISAALLIYGVFDFAKMGMQVPGAPEPTPELAVIGEKLMELMVGSYLGSERSRSLLEDVRVSPIHAANRLPPCHVVCGSADPLVLQAESLVRKLEAAGVVHEHVVVEGMPHGFAQMEFFPQARESIDRMIDFLRKHVD
jgi:acetyl esterase